MSKKLRGIVPACVTFGPLFMTRVAGTADERFSGTLTIVGVAMLAIGLITMFRIILAQQRAIKMLQAERRSDHEAVSAHRHAPSNAV